MCKIFSALFRADVEGASRPGILPVAALFFMLVFAFSVFVDAGYAQVNSGKIAGRVTDGRGNPLPAANVIIGETAMGAATDNNGEYVITKVPAGSYNVKVNYIGYEQNIQEVQVRVDDVVRADFIMDERQVVEGEEVTVYGEITRGQAKALSMQQNAVGIEHVVSHEIIRRFPDETAGEALRRMPGVSAIDYSQGVPSSLRVRAMSDDKNKVFINGMAAPGGALAMIPSNILESVSLSKVITPDMDADAMGEPLILKVQVAPSEPQFFARAQGGINTLEFGPENRANNNYSFFVKGGRRFMNDKIGVLGRRCAFWGAAAGCRLNPCVTQTTAAILSAIVFQNMMCNAIGRWAISMWITHPMKAINTICWSAKADTEETKLAVKLNLTEEKRKCPKVKSKNRFAITIGRMISPLPSLTDSTGWAMSN
ncbi:MAG: carboxypeptidase-like regulatory domain-containing protein [candidate division KSB1 bacterium]|nr:carboxypeptidase-like regulatory domain-containing protein [candidate division KSB1 bacterium]